MRLKWWLISCLLVLAGCGGADQVSCGEDGDCPEGQVCKYDQCVDPGWVGGAGTDASTEDSQTDVERTLQTPGRIEFDRSGQERTIELANAGNAPVTIHGVDIESDAFHLASVDEGSDADLPTVISAGESMLLDLTFKTTDPGTHRGQLAIDSNADGGMKSVELVGRRSECLEVTPSGELAFQPESPLETATREVTVTNCSNSRSFGLVAGIIEDDDVFELEGDRREYELSAGQSTQIPIVFNPSEQTGSFEARLEIETDLPDRSLVTVDLRGEASYPCPTPKISMSAVDAANPITDGTIQPTQTIELDGSESQAPGGVQSYQWSVVDRPVPTAASFRPSNRAVAPEIMIDAAGTWKFQLTVTGRGNASDCPAATASIRAVPEAKIYVELTWTTPDDDNPDDSEGADLDLHYLSPKATQWDTAPYDIYWHNRRADWNGNGLTQEDPHMLVDHTYGPGPEIITHDNPAVTSSPTYTIGVFYYDDLNIGESVATVRIFLEGSLTRTFGPRKLQEMYDFWKVALIEWPSENIYDRDQVHDDFPD